MPDTETTSALTTIIDALKPLKSEERQRTVDAAMTFLGETTKTVATEREVGAPGATDGAGDGHRPAAITRWMRQYGVSADELDLAFHFKEGSFEVLDVPGKSDREKTLNAYILTGLGTYLTTGERAFGDAAARGLCVKIGCYDANNHSSTIKHHGSPEFTGDKKKGYTLTTPGVKRGAGLVKELAGAAK